jgi:hemolysin activation/secretion protein
MPGLLRGVARTAVVAGTATAVSGRVQRRQAEKYAGRDAQIAADRNAAYQEDVQQQAPPPPPPAPVAAAPAEETPADQITRLGELKAQGLLTDEEFAAAKAKVLGI